MHLPQAPPYTDAPPAYSELYRQGYVHQPAPNMPTLSAPYPGTSMYVPMPQTMPPPPPGCPPNAAQLAAMQGANVVVTQRKGNYFMGGSDGGYTMWKYQYKIITQQIHPLVPHLGFRLYDLLSMPR
ncbi:hypothetical protein AB205_0089240, partial [Aquarana catesbeiana]